jgi:hypothetical protein
MAANTSGRALRSLIADILSLPLSFFDSVPPDTGFVDYGLGPSASRGITMRRW